MCLWRMSLAQLRRSQKFWFNIMAANWNFEVSPLRLVVIIANLSSSHSYEMILWILWFKVCQGSLIHISVCICSLCLDCRILTQEENFLCFLHHLNRCSGETLLYRQLEEHRDFFFPYVLQKVGHISAKYLQNSLFCINRNHQPQHAVKVPSDSQDNVQEAQLWAVSYSFGGVSY